MPTNNLGLTIPYAGKSIEYVDQLNTNWSIIDMHDHTSAGSFINQDSINWSSIDMDFNPINGYSFLAFNPRTAVTSPSTLYVGLDGELYFFDGSSNDIQLTSNGSLNITDTYDGFFGNMSLYDASAVFTSSDLTYTFNVGTTGAECQFNDYSGSSDCIFSGTLTISSIATVDSQVKIWTDSIFPGDYDSTKDDAGLTTFYVDENGQPRKTYVVDSYTANSSAYGNLENCFLSSVSNNINDVKYLYLYGTTAGTIALAPTNYSELGAPSITLLEYDTGATSEQNSTYISTGGHFYYYTYPINCNSIISNLSYGTHLPSRYGTSVLVVEAAPDFDFGSNPVDSTLSTSPTYSELYDYPSGTGLIRSKVVLASSTGFVVHYEYHIVWLYSDDSSVVDPSTMTVTTCFETMIQSSDYNFRHFDFWLGIRALTAASVPVTNFKIVMTFYILGAEQV